MKLFKHIKIKTQLVVGLIFISFLTLTLGVISMSNIQQISDRIDIIVTHPIQVRIAIDGLNQEVLIQEIGLHHLVLADTEPERQSAILSINESKARVETHFKTLEDLYLGPQSDVVAAKAAYINWEFELDRLLQLVLDGDIDLALDDMEIGDNFVNYQNNLSDSLQIILNFAMNKRYELFSNIQSLSANAMLQVIVFSLIAVSISIIIVVVLNNNVQKPITVMQGAVTDYQKGNLSVRSNYENKDEFGTLSIALNEMLTIISMDVELNKRIQLMNDAMLYQEDMHSFFHNTIRLLMQLTDAQMGAIYVVNNNLMELERIESIGFDTEPATIFNLNQMEGQFGIAYSSKTIQKVMIEPNTLELRFSTVIGQLIPKEIISIPLISGDQVIAMISLVGVNGLWTETEKFVERMHDTITARFESVFAQETIKDYARKTEDKNRELDMQASELSQLNTELTLQKIELTKAGQLKTHFLSTMSHELRTPLNSVIALSSILTRKLIDIIPQEEHGYLQIIERNGKNLLSLINDILDISRIESGHDEVEQSAFSPQELMNAIMDELRPQAETKGIAFIMEGTSLCDAIISDPKKIRHILQNIIGNAIKFTDKGSVKVEFIHQNETIDFYVTDTGIGISDDQIDSIFDEFKQADSSISRKYGGTGLGLAIATKYAQLLGGSISVQSTLGEGSRFVVTIPCRCSDSDRDDQIETESFEPVSKTVKFTLENQAEKKTVLLVDDNEEAIIQIRILLEESGYHVLSANKAVEAFRIMEKKIPDAIVLDITMPEIDGFAVLKAIREVDSTSHIPVLVLTAKTITKDELKFLKRNNVHQLIQKGDINSIQLHNAVTKMLYPTSQKAKLRTNKIGSIEKPIILIVEDNIDNMITAKALLVDEFIVYGAVDGAEGIEMAKMYHPDLILMDIALPGIDGIEAFKVIRSTPTLQDIPVFAVTASAMSHERESILTHGFDAFIAKPIVEQELMRSIHEVLYGK